MRIIDADELVNFLTEIYLDREWSDREVHFSLRDMINNIDEVVKNQKVILGISTALYDQEEIHKNCTVQVLSNSVTGETSVGWWENEV